jgi:hypothetical protein
MGRDLLEELEQNLLGLCCSIERGEFDWSVNLDGGGSITLPVPWRIVADGRIALADTDDGQQFGLPAPLDGQAEANRLLGGKPITEVRVDPQTADLTIQFDGGVRLDVFNHSAGYEGWHINLPPERGGMWVIALGGGDVTIFA